MIGIFEKLGLIGWFVGMATLLIACIFGILGFEAVASVVAAIGCCITVFGLAFGLVAFVRFIWRQ